MRMLLILALLCATLLSTTTPASAANNGASLEIYPSGDLFFCGWMSNDTAKLDLWATPNSEIGFSVGPDIKGFRFGIGASSMVTDDGFIGLGYVNIDVGFTLEYDKLTWSSYNLGQIGQNGVSDFKLSRNWLNYSYYQLGVVGHNRQCGDDPWELYWGPSFNIGDLGLLQNTRLCLAFNLNPTDQTGDIWTAWIFDF